MTTAGQDLVGSGTAQRLTLEPWAARLPWRFAAAVVACVLVTGAFAAFLAANSGTARGQDVGNVGQRQKPVIHPVSLTLLAHR